MKYEINFDNTAVDKMYRELSHCFMWSEHDFEAKDLERNARNSACFQCILNTLKMFGVETKCGTYDEDGYTRIGYAKINDYEIIKHTQLNSHNLQEALWEIAHKEENL